MIMRRYKSQLAEGYLSATKYGKRLGLSTVAITVYIEKRGLPAEKIRHGLNTYYAINVAEADAWFRAHPEIVLDFNFSESRT